MKSLGSSILADEISGAVRRYAGLVYATARRIVGDGELAEDVTQAAFLVMARKFHRIDARRLPGWLVNTTRLSARQALRGEMTRERHERRAAAERGEGVDGEPGVGELVPLLDDALGKLNEVDRTAVVLRFFQGESFARVAECIGGSEDAARKRVERAVEKLRGIFMEQGVLPSVGGVMLLLAGEQVRGVPEGMVLKLMQRSTLNTQRSTLDGRLGGRIGLAMKGALAVLVAGLGIVAVVNRVGAGMGATTMPATAEATNFVAKLGDGITMELFGVNDNPDEGKPGWRADGSALDVGVLDGVANRTGGEGDRAVEIGIRFTGTDRQKRPWNALNIQWMSNVTGLGLAGRIKNGKQVANEFVLLGVIPKDQDQMDVVIHLAPKAAQVVARVKATGAGSKNVGDVLGVGRFELSNPREVDGAAMVTANIPDIPDGWQVVVRAVPRSAGYILAADPRSALVGTEGKAKDISYQAKLAEVAEFRVELRDYTTAVEFRNVSLKAGVTTNFHIVTHEAEAGAGEKGL